MTLEGCVCVNSFVVFFLGGWVGGGGVAWWAVLFWKMANVHTLLLSDRRHLKDFI